MPREAGASAGLEKTGDRVGLVETQATQLVSTSPDGEQALKRRARRQALFLMVASALVTIVVLYFVWSGVRQLF